MAKDNLVSVTLLDRTLSIKCLPEETPALQQSAKYYNDQAAKYRMASPFASIESLSMITALNITQQLITTKQYQNAGGNAINQRIAAIRKNIQAVLQSEQEETNA